MATNQMRNMVTLSVPIEHYAATVAFLGQLMSGAPAATAAAIAASLSGNAQSATTTVTEFPSDVLQAIKKERQSVWSPAVHAMLDLVADRPGGPVTPEEVMKRAGIEKRQLRGQLASFTKMLNRRGVSGWPVRAERDANGRILYIGTKEFAREWNKKP